MRRQLQLLICALFCTQLLVLAQPSWDSEAQFAPSCTKFAFLKSLKTGSTTFANILFRMAASQGKRGYKQVAGTDHSIDYQNMPAKRDDADVVMSHIKQGCVAKGEFPRLLKFYEEVRHGRALAAGSCRGVQARAIAAAAAAVAQSGARAYCRRTWRGMLFAKTHQIARLCPRRCHSALALACAGPHCRPSASQPPPAGRSAQRACPARA